MIIIDASRGKCRRNELTHGCLPHPIGPVYSCIPSMMITEGAALGAG